MTASRMGGTSCLHSARSDALVQPGGYWADLLRHTSLLGRCAARRSAATPALLASFAPRLARNSTQSRATPQSSRSQLDPVPRDTSVVSLATRPSSEHLEVTDWPTRAT